MITHGAEQRVPLLEGDNERVHQGRVEEKHEGHTNRKRIRRTKDVEVQKIWSKCPNLVWIIVCARPSLHLVAIRRNAIL